MQATIDLYDYTNVDNPGSRNRQEFCLELDRSYFCSFSTLYNFQKLSIS